MTRIQLRLLRDEDVPDVAAFLARMRREEQSSDTTFDLAAESHAFEQRLRWQFEQNPARIPDLAWGHQLRDSEGRVVGTHLAIPQRFTLEGKALLGLLSGDLRAEPQAARYSSGMFLAYLRLRGADFHYATTANLDSGAFWEQTKAPAVPESDLEFVLPLRFGPVLEELALRRGLGAFGAGTARIVGLPVTWAARLLRGSPAGDDAIVLRPCSDWEHLAALAARHCDPRLMTHERSSAYLRWRYEAAPGSERNRVFLLKDRAGREAWAVVQSVVVGAGRQVRELRLMDLVWPREGMDPTQLLRAILQHVPSDCDMVRIKGGTVPGWVPTKPGFRRRQLAGPTSYVAEGWSGGPLAARAHFVGGDSDTP